MEHKKELEESLKLKASIEAKQKRPGFKKFVKEVLAGWFPSRDAIKFPEGVQKERVIDRGSNKYAEKIVDEATGKVVRDVKERLTDHK